MLRNWHRCAQLTLLKGPAGQDTYILIHTNSFRAAGVKGIFSNTISLCCEQAGSIDHRKLSGKVMQVLGIEATY